jgi:hypothetical protein
MSKGQLVVVHTATINNHRIHTSSLLGLDLCIVVIPIQLLWLCNTNKCMHACCLADLSKVTFIKSHHDQTILLTLRLTNYTTQGENTVLLRGEICAHVFIALWFNDALRTNSFDPVNGLRIDGVCSTLDCGQTQICYSGSHIHQLNHQQQT